MLGCVLLLAACPKREEKPLAAALCKGVTATRVDRRWSVTLDVQGAVLARHGARFAAKKIEPNGVAWAGLMEQCAKPEALRGVELDPEGGSLHAWVDSEAHKDGWVAALCQAIEDTAWLDRCFATLDREKLDD
jgi:hypothetical protein